MVRVGGEKEPLDGGGDEREEPSSITASPRLMMRKACSMTGAEASTKRKVASKAGDAIFVLAWGFVKLLDASLGLLEKRLNSNGLHESLLVIMNLCDVEAL